MAEAKEPAFFSTDEGSDRTGDLRRGASGALRKGWKWYELLYRHCPDDALRGEASTMYLYSESTPLLLKRYVPSVKLIFLFRNPVDQIYSNYWHHAGRFERLPPFETLVNESHPRFEYFLQVATYSDHLTRYKAQFPTEQILCLVTEDLARDPRQVTRLAFSFLGVADDFIPQDLRTRMNQGSMARSLGLERYLRKLHAPLWWPQLARTWGRRAKMAISARNRRALSYPPMPERVRSQLAATLLPEVQRMEELLGRDLPAWHL